MMLPENDPTVKLWTSKLRKKAVAVSLIKEIITNDVDNRIYDLHNKPGNPEAAYRHELTNYDRVWPELNRSMADTPLRDQLYAHLKLRAEKLAREMVIDYFYNLLDRQQSSPEDIAKLKDLVRQEREQAGQLAKVNATLQTNLAVKESENAKLREANTTLEFNLDSLATQVASLAAEISELKAKNTELESELKSANASRRSYKSWNTRYREQIQEFKATIADLKRRLGDHG